MKNAIGCLAPRATTPLLGKRKRSATDTGPAPSAKRTRVAERAPQPLLAPEEHQAVYSCAPADVFCVLRQTNRAWFAASLDPTILRKQVLAFDNRAAITPRGPNQLAESQALTEELVRKLRVRRNILHGRAVVTELTGQPSAMRHAAFSPSGEQALTVSLDNWLQVWDVRTALPTSRALHGLSASVHGAAFSPDETRVAAVSQAGEVALWDLVGVGPRVEAVAVPVHTGRATSVAFSPDGRQLATIGFDGLLRVWDLSETGGLIERHTLQHTGQLTSVQFFPDGERLLVCGYQALSVWSLGDASKPQELKLAGHSGIIWSAKLSPDASFCVSCGGDATARLWRLRTRPGTPAILAGHEAGVWRADISRDGKRIATSSADKTVKVWDVSGPTPRVMVTLPGHGNNTGHVAFSADGGCVMTTGTEGPSLLRAWDLRAPMPRESVSALPCLMPPPAPPYRWWNINSISIAPRGDRILLAGSNNRARILNFNG